jgi:hypothetical protein
MAKVIENGRFTSVAVEHNGPQFQVWRFDREQREYEVSCLKRGGLAVTFRDVDAVELAADLEAVHTGSSTPEALEAKLAAKIDAFLGSIEQ